MDAVSHEQERMAPRLTKAGKPKTAKLWLQKPGESNVNWMS